MISKLLSAAAAFAILAGSAAPAFAGPEYLYDSAGRLIQVTYSNGVVITYRYDASGNRQQITTANIPNRAPRARADSAAVLGSGTVDVSVLGNDTDPDRDPLTITAVSSVSGGTATILQNPWRVRYVAPATPSTQTFTYTISDGQSHTASATVTVLVSGGNQPPVAMADSFNASTSSNMSLLVLANDTDPNNNTLTVTAVGTATGGTASVAMGGGYVVYDAPGTPGIYTFTYTISDGLGGTASSTVTVDVSSLEGGGECVPTMQNQCDIEP